MNTDPSNPCTAQPPSTATAHQAANGDHSPSLTATVPEVVHSTANPTLRPTSAVFEVPPQATPLPSQALLQGRSAVAIAHNGHIYRLQATRQGKLILTK